MPIEKIIKKLIKDHSRHNQHVAKGKRDVFPSRHSQSANLIAIAKGIDNADKGRGGIASPNAQRAVVIQRGTEKSF
ncbi:MULTISPECIES: hypothetical protein [Shewanella]|uniref:Uncharacterized protein n=1 Tax=Shewanella psychromarinicola TaxID=2487742 RepID=A0A3N4F1F8_9GAMM|nr:hypothetical protein [Shewanella psychromarinicola]AZG37010.1 hypothetical protein EGC80_20490 [Shewanella psychromarinicola]MCL1081151.1 hypothetical protein [Shewanella psychromarinicola]RPA34864.1 hypothetical protein EGC77_04160 [Shewanella psychromarinicola]